MVEMVSRLATASNVPNLAVPLSSLTTSAAPVELIRGGAEVLDLTRTRIGLEALHTFAVMTTLLMNASLRLFTSTPKKLDEKRPSYENLAKIFFGICVAMSVVFGGYCVIVFSLMGLYSKGALGLGQDEALVEFLAQTEGIRAGGFNAFLASLLFFKCSFLSSVFINYEGKMRWWLAGLVLAVDLIGWWKWSTIHVLASKLIFK